MKSNNSIMPPFPPSARVRAAKDQISCDLAGEAVILQLADGVYYGLNEVGARVWSLIQEQCSIGEIQSVIEDEYDVDAEQCGEDLQTLLRQLENKGLIVIQKESDG